MAFVTGLFLVDAPASALNNLGNIPGERYDNSVGVKVIRTREGIYPYVSAQAFRYWLRTTLEKSGLGWVAAPVYREEKIAYTDANPIRWWDDDLFGYMRAPSKRESARAKREADESRAGETETVDTVTRAAPFRVSTLVSLAPVTPTSDFGVMSRQEGDPVPHEHQFYRATLKGLFSLDLKASGTFWYRQKTGFRNLDDVRIEEAKKAGLIHLEGEKAYRLPLDQRIQRVATLFEGMAILDGGAKQTLHYTDVAPPLVIMAVTKGGNHIFHYVVGATIRGLPELKLEALKEALAVFREEILSDVYVGWVRGYLDEERAKLEDFAATSEGQRVKIGHPREAFKALIEALKNPTNAASWME
ncbi:MAG TPA: type I-B CRISPR-associated protein Cas7/Cst2/DevR [Peptococcaceae bacterium]|nr:type I-B CRISPR-associated protein Cas7/Cst2/DevR [Peptococcaceae bacterium]